jgi:hypothetical protein
VSKRDPMNERRNMMSEELMRDYPLIPAKRIIRFPIGDDTGDELQSILALDCADFVESIGLTGKAKNALLHQRCTCVEDLKRLEVSEMLKWRGCGYKTVIVILKKLQELGIKPRFGDLYSQYLADFKKYGFDLRELERRG